jgi:hypothetical protein
LTLPEALYLGAVQKVNRNLPVQLAYNLDHASVLVSHRSDQNISKLHLCTLSTNKLKRRRDPSFPIGGIHEP